MSLRRAVEAHIKWCLDPHFTNTKHQVFESLRLADKPMPSIVVISGVGSPAMPEFPDSLDNWKVPVTIVVMSSIDESTVEEHSDIVYLIGQVLAKDSARHKSKVQGLYVYDIVKGSTGEENEGRKMVTVVNCDTLVNYAPTPALED